jgi:hypothetical protein
VGIRELEQQLALPRRVCSRRTLPRLHGMVLTTNQVDNEGASWTVAHRRPGERPGRTATDRLERFRNSCVQGLYQPCRARPADRSLVAEDRSAGASAPGRDRLSAKRERRGAGHIGATNEGHQRTVDSGQPRSLAVYRHGRPTGSPGRPRKATNRPDALSHGRYYFRAGVGWSAVGAVRWR